MSGGSHARASGSHDPVTLTRRLRQRLRLRPSRRNPRRNGPWRVGTPLVVVVCGALFVVSAYNSQGTDLRPGRYTDLASLVQGEAEQYDALRQRVAQLSDQVAAMTAALSDRDVNRYHRRIERLKDPAGLEPRTGPGVTVTLSDAPEDLINSTTGDINRLLVHQQDIQAVVNALWRGGATAITINGQRIVSTTGIKCEGNAVQLQGVPYPQPYVISAIGDQATLVAALDSDSYVRQYRDDADNPDVSVGWSLKLVSSLTAPAYNGLLDLNYATPLPSSASPG